MWKVQEVVAEAAAVVLIVDVDSDAWSLASPFQVCLLPLSIFKSTT